LSNAVACIAFHSGHSWRSLRRLPFWNQPVAFAFGATFEIVMPMLVVGLAAAIAGSGLFKQS
jgi:hypothetical protein